MEKRLKVIVEKHPDGYLAYPLGLKGIVVGEGESFVQALEDMRSAIRFHVGSFGKDALEGESEVVEAFIAEAVIAV